MFHVTQLETSCNETSATCRLKTVKVTLSGVPICTLDIFAQSKLPYECLLVAETNTFPAVTKADTNVIVSVPSAIQALFGRDSVCPWPGGLGQRAGNIWTVPYAKVATYNNQVLDSFRKCNILSNPDSCDKTGAYVHMFHVNLDLEHLEKSSI